MNLYLLTQGDNTGYDTYDSCVVVAKNEDEAKKIHPSGDDEQSWKTDKIFRSWANSPDTVEAELIGKAVKGSVSGTVICSSFNAG